MSPFPPFSGRRLSSGKPSLSQSAPSASGAPRLGAGACPSPAGSSRTLGPCRSLALFACSLFRSHLPICVRDLKV